MIASLDCIQPKIQWLYDTLGDPDPVTDGTLAPKTVWN